MQTRLKSKLYSGINVGSNPTLTTKNKIKDMKILLRLVYVLQAPLFFIYMCLPFLWIINIPYWILTGRDLMEDWFQYNEDYKI